ncbi:thioredoxin reductase (NADPH) [Caldalkalibacillus uzonensis]|uniref:Thioredoxin reductase (NADPH) n=1 Tax=Caldalkalibacillus uzonensis TaxID=353224 RepID=A0ABU0CPC6_9BACI|nr:FAD-dependent oxidoreductase [Caldalkalibacillus uzonensis]MDQ0338249.1 thioredoxin reductase (NADPH) [Caldalkalibacillus uzonensis]
MKIVVYTSIGCPYCEKIKNDLKTWGYTNYEEKNVQENPSYFDELHEHGIFSTPVTFVNGEAVVGYRPNKMKQILGVNEENQNNNANQENKESIFQPVDKKILEEVWDFVTIGGGPAGASAAVYAARGNLKTLVIDKAPTSGTLAITHKIANYPGVREELTGLALLERMQLQAKDFGATFVQSNVISVDFSQEIKELEVPEGKIKAKSVFIAVGAKAPSSKIKGEEEFTGRGVSYCSTCDAAFFKGMTVAVAGETEEAVSEAYALSKHADKVLFLIPGSKLKGDADVSLVENLPNVKIYWKHRIKEIFGEKKVEGIRVQDDQRELVTWHVDGVFLYLAGMKPGTDFLQDAVERDEEGYVIVDETLRTNVDGVFAGGDARRTPIKQAVISAADGCIAAMGADQHVNKRKKMRPQYS